MTQRSAPDLWPALDDSESLGTEAPSSRGEARDDNRGAAPQILQRVVLPNRFPAARAILGCSSWKMVGGAPEGRCLAERSQDYATQYGVHTSEGHLRHSSDGHRVRLTEEVGERGERSEREEHSGRVQEQKVAVWQKIVDHAHGGSEVDAVVVVSQGVQSTTAQQRHQAGG